MNNKKRCFVYVLRSCKNNKRYVGSTQVQPEERLKQHNGGSNKWTRGNRPFRLIYAEEVESKEEARQRERFLKSGVGRKFLDERFRKEAAQFPPEADQPLAEVRALP